MVTSLILAIQGIAIILLVIYICTVNSTLNMYQQQLDAHSRHLNSLSKTVHGKENWERALREVDETRNLPTETS